VYGRFSNVGFMTSAKRAKMAALTEACMKEEELRFSFDSPSCIIR
jgi:hypothetical protein